MKLGERVPLATLPVPSTSFLSEATFYDLRGKTQLRYEVERDGVAYRAGLQFETVRAYRFRTEGHCTVWHVDGVYDTLAELLDSEWVGELLAAEPAETWGHWEIHHFMIYVDSTGCFEIAAQSWSWLPEERLS